MLLVCALPLLIFFVLALFGVQLHPLWVPLIMILCCLAMFYLTAGACGHEHAERVPEVVQEEPTLLLPQTLKTDDVFRVQHSRQAGATLVQEGELLMDADEAYAALKKRTEGVGVTPLLQEDRHGNPLLVWLPGTLEQEGGKQRGPLLHVLLFLLTLVTTTWAGALHAGVNLLEEPQRFPVGLLYSLPLLLILGTHEFGHYFAARAHRMRVTLPYFIPVPFGLGTFGAFIQLKSPAENRRALFDVGVAGPLAGLVIAIPALWIGLQ
jgi:hypothetical protein